VRTAAVVALAFAVATPALAQRPARRGKLDAGLRGRAERLTGRSRVIVQFAGAPDVRAITAVHGRAGRRLRGAQVAELDNRELANLAADPRVTWISEDRPAFATLERTGAAIGSTLARDEFDVSGDGVGVAVIDSGITSWHDDLNLPTGGYGRRVVHFKDFTTTGSPNVWTPTVPSDPYGHGTHVAGIIAGSGFDSDGRRTGVAPGVHLVGLKVLDGDGNGYVSDVIAAIDYAVAIKDTYNVRVINLSVGAGVTESYWLDPLAQAAKRAVDAGIVVVASAGNLGLNAEGESQYGGITSPGNAPWVLTVGASSHQGTARRSDDVIGGFSSRGPTWIDFAAKPDIVAPGVGIESLADPHSTLYADYPDYLLDGSRPMRYKPYLSLSGTSMAAPVVSGTVALMLEANPGLTPNAVKAILEYTAQDARGVSPLAAGAGLLNAHGAVRMARFFAAPQRGLGPAGDTIADEWIPWSQHLIWGNYEITGGVPLPGSNAWTDALTWGALQAPDGAPVVWGASSAKNIVWSTSTSNNIVWSTSTADNIVWSTGGSGNIVWSTTASNNIVWSTGTANNIVWSTSTADNIVWSTAYVNNVVWGDDCGGRNCMNVVWGDSGANGIWGTAVRAENIVWSTNAADDNIVWSTAGMDNIVWSTATADNIVWSTSISDNIVWSTGTAEQVLWPPPATTERRRASAAH
jgi:serine protease AprX